MSLNDWRRRMAWARPLLPAVGVVKTSEFREFGAKEAVTRLLLYAYWLGLIACEGSPSEPTAIGRGPLLFALQTGEAPAPPREYQFIVQPTGEVITTPDLCPAVLYQLRRFTAHPKKAPAGVYAVEPGTVDECLRSGVAPEALTAFLERHSRHPVPDTVRQIIADSGRRLTRIQLFPADVILRTDSAEMMEELSALPKIGPLLGPRIVDRVALIPADHFRKLLTELTRRGYSPLDGTVLAEAPPLEPVEEITETDLDLEAAAEALQS